MGQVLEFTKMHGAGNDFVVLDGLREELPELDSLAAALLHRRFGIGGDQLLVARRGQAAEFFMEIFNPDGSRAEMCANGIRAFYKWLRDRGYTDRDEIEVETLAGIVRPRWAGLDRVSVDMGPPILAPARVPTRLRSDSARAEEPALDVPLELAETTVRVSAISMGNPHAVVFVESTERTAVAELGPEIERHGAFPNRTNVEFAEIVSRERIRQRTWERGTGETLACGSGACAVAVAAMLQGTVARSITVELLGGELEIEWPAPGSGVIMTGPAAEVFTGRFPVEGA